MYLFFLYLLHCLGCDSLFRYDPGISARGSSKQATLVYLSFLYLLHCLGCDSLFRYDSSGCDQVHLDVPCLTLPVAPPRRG